ncbi:MAG: glycosyltransferase [Bdellovibrionales bacterium]|nr:glycosyltransferase [Bdellovibrionales bacterium]
MRIHQFVHTLNYGDAISGEAVAIRRLLNRSGIGSEIYCVNAHEKLEDIGRPWTRFDADRQEAEQAGEPVAVLLHYSIGSPLNTLLRSSAGILRGLIYHNLTPVEWFAPYNSVVTANLVEGRAELPQLLQTMDLVLADSEYNERELKEFGCADTQVLPLCLDQEKWQIGPNVGIASMLRAHGGTNVLHVGRLAPNKCLEDIIKTFYFYHHKIDRTSRLWLIGGDIDTEIYSFELRRLVSELRLKEAVYFVGSVSDCELRAFYEAADLYLCMSEHEGFCVPLLEAMHFRVPIIAYDACAVSETLGDAGLLVRQKEHAQIAELMAMVREDAQLRESLLSRAGLRLERFSEAVFAENLRIRVTEPFAALAKQTHTIRNAGEVRKAGGA